MVHVGKMTPETKWAAIKDVLSEGLNKKQARILGMCLDSTRNDYVARQRMLMENASGSAVSTGNIATLNKVILPIIRRVLPNVIANEIVGVQPMPGPTAQIMTMRYTYGNTISSAGVIAGEEAMAPLHVRDLAVALSGNQQASFPAGALTAQLEGVPGNVLKLEMLKQTVDARTRRLAARWTVEAQTDASNQYGVDIEEELVNAVAQEIVVEIDQEILRSLRALPPAATAINTFDISAATGQPNSIVDYFAALAVLMNREANKIATRTRRGKGNWAVVSPTVLTILESARASAFVRTVEGNFEAPTNNKYVGTMNNAMKLFVDTYADDSTPILIGYKGPSEIDAATFYCPYVPLTTHGVVVDPNTFEFVTSFYSRYGYVQFTNTASSLGNSKDYLGTVGINSGTLTWM